MSDATENYSFLKYVTLILNPGSFAVRQLLKKKMKYENLTLRDFLNQRKHKIFHLHRTTLCCLCQPQTKIQQRRLLRNEEWEILFEKINKKCKVRHIKCCCNYSAVPYIGEDDLDITMVVFLLINLFPLSDEEKKNLEDLRGHRKYYGHAKKASIEDTEYVERLTKATSVITTIAQSCEDPQIHKRVCGWIRDIMDSYFYSACYKEIVTSNREEQMTRDMIEKSCIATADVMKTKKEITGGATGDQNEKEKRLTPQKCAAELRKRLNEIKGHSVHDFSQRRKQRPSVVCHRHDSKTLPSTFTRKYKKALSVPVDNKNSLKKDEIDFVLKIIEMCKKESLEEIEDFLNGLSQDCRLLRVMDKKGYKPIHYTAERYDSDARYILEALLDHGANIEDQTFEGMTVLHIACKNGNVELVDYCITEHPCLLNMEDQNGFNAALFAVFYGHIPAFTSLRIERGLTIKSQKTSVNILHLACLGGNMEVFLKIFKDYPDIKRDIDQEGRAILHYVARGGNNEMLDVLLEDPWARKQLEHDAKTTGSILHIACLYGHDKICRKLISEYPQMLHNRDGYGLHAMQYAVRGGKITVMHLLKDLLNKMVMEYIDFGEPKTDILQLACVYQKNAMWKYIVNEFPDLLLKRDNEGWCMTHVAARCDNCEVLKMILDLKETSEDNQHMPKWNEKDNLDRTVLHIAGLYGSLNICRYLVSKFSQLTTERDKYGCLACTLAAKGGNEDVFCLLFDESSNIIDDNDKVNIFEAARQSINPEMMHCISSKYPDLQLVDGLKTEMYINNQATAYETTTL